jgi:hypothetical protein
MTQGFQHRPFSTLPKRTVWGDAASRTSQMARLVALRGALAVALLALGGVLAAPTVAQPAPLTVLQSSDGSLFFAQAANAWLLVPGQISDDDLSALSPSGDLIGAIPSGLLGSYDPSAASLQVSQGGDGTLYLIQGGNVWTLAADPIDDVGLAALNIRGEADGSPPAEALNAPPPAPAATPAPQPVVQTTAALSPVATANVTAVPTAVAPTTGTGFAGRPLQMSVYNPTLTTFYQGPFKLDAVPGTFATLPAPGLVPVDITVTNTAIAIGFTKSAPYSQFALAGFNGYVFTPSAGTPVIGGVSIDPSTTLKLDMTRVSSTGTVVRINVQGLTFNTRTTAKVNVKFNS